MEPTDASDACESVLAEVGEAVVADQAFLETVLIALLSRGHVLLEDVPGTGKTLTARSIATALGLEFSRVQFTPDLLPSDVTGTNVYNEREGTFEFSAGPIFANVVLADEINRAPPKTQSALLEAMAERQVTRPTSSSTWPRSRVPPARTAACPWACLPVAPSDCSRLPAHTRPWPVGSTSRPPVRTARVSGLLLRSYCRT